MPTHTIIHTISYSSLSSSLPFLSLSFFFSFLASSLLFHLLCLRSSFLPPVVGVEVPCLLSSVLHFLHPPISRPSRLFFLLGRSYSSFFLFLTLFSPLHARSASSIVLFPIFSNFSLEKPEARDFFLKKKKKKKRQGRKKKALRSCSHTPTLSPTKNYYLKVRRLPSPPPPPSLPRP